jgi:hypothetical protein
MSIVCEGVCEILSSLSRSSNPVHALTLAASASRHLHSAYLLERGHVDFPVVGERGEVDIQDVFWFELELPFTPEDFCMAL